MKTTSMLAASLVSLAAATTAFADDRDAALQLTESPGGFDHHVAAPTHALELGIATGYSQGVGPLGGGMNHLEDVASAGGAIELDAMYRMNPTFAIGAYGTFSTHSTGDLIDAQNDVLGATAGIQAAAHFRPTSSVDPWVSLGTGWRGLWLAPDSGKNTSIQGLELARLQIGVDYRVTEDISIAPVIGGSANLFVAQDSPMTIGYSEINDKKMNFVAFAGLAGRFDLGGSR